ncbi:ABC transporter permease [Anaerolinea thermophila]|jgi:peptide/nickel transport system permease protein|uniref:ABC transporter permease n=2 Tax=Anaerolinea TaxID=233189 RepID=UPI0026F0219E|nr:ABC transporter permease [Anaerolinea thermophila]
MANKKLKSASAVILRAREHESYGTLVWRRFRKSKIAILGGLMVIMLIVLAIFSDFFAPYDPVRLNMRSGYIPPHRVHFIDAEGKFHLRPFIYGWKQVLDENMFPKWVEDTSKAYPIYFFVRGWEYKLLGFIPMNIHLYGLKDPEGMIFLLGSDKFGRDIFSRSCLAGRISLSMSLFGTIISVAVGSVLGVISGYFGGAVDTYMQRFVEFVQSFPQLPLWMALAAIIPDTWDQFAVFVVMSSIFALLSWTLLAREVRGKVLSLRETDFVLAAREMGASDWRIIFHHLYPNTLSHTIVVLTLTIPTIILAESFLSFLGIGIQEPLVSWGVMMREAQTIQTLGFNIWIISPVFFIFIAVLGWNFLGDGLRDAADPYTIL